MRAYVQRAEQRREELDRALVRFVETARRFSDVRAVYVFGSFARGDVGPRRDLDLLVVRDTARRGPSRGEDLAMEALLGIEYDLVVVTPAEYAARSSASSFWHRIVNEARQVYAA